MTYFKEILTISLGLLLLLVVQGASGSEDKVGVVYPDLREPYRTIFTNIIEGVMEVTGDNITILSVKKDYKVEKISQWINDNNIKSLISLGSRGKRLTSNIEIENKVIGAITKPPKGNNFKAGIMLTPDPQNIFSEINRLVPDVKNVYVIYSEKNSGLYIEIAKESAWKYGIKLITIRSESKKESLEQYESILNGQINKTSAFWLLQDSLSSDRRLILPYVLEMAWSKKIPVISNKAGHVERGALLALYPDHFELGVSLAKMLLNQKMNKQKFVPFKASFNAANIRTADHLKLNWTRKLKRSFDLIFPKR